MTDQVATGKPRLAGKRAVVTGSSSGIGRDIALLLAAEGASVVVNARGTRGGGAGAIDAVVDEIRAAGGRAIAFRGAVDDPAVAGELIDECVKHFGGIDILINNAGIVSPQSLGPVTRCSLEEWEQTLKVNLNGPFFTSRAALPHMVKQRWGRIVNAGSFAGGGRMGGSAYSASKSALLGFSRAMASDYGPYGITVNVYAPEARTPMSDDGLHVYEQSLKYWETKGFRTPAETQYLRGLGGPEGVAPWVAYLCTQEAGYINGRAFAVESRRVALLGQPDEERVLFREFEGKGRWSVDDLVRVAPLAFPIQNSWPPRTGEDLARWEKG
ncbi:MAG: SDR family NAD(P)-dependent oxidoreductase [Steroidobacteraceae bacterium]